MKKLSVVLFLAGISIMQACNSTPKDSVDTADSMNDERDTSGMMSNDAGTVNNDAADFAVKAANGGMMEVQLGEYASKNASDKSVRDFGAMLVKDHSKANDELKSLASSKNIALPNNVGDDMMNNMNDLMKKTGTDFDKAYMNDMVDDHKDDIDLFQKAADNSPDPDIKAFAAKTLPTLKEHLNAAEAIVKSHNY